MYNTFKYHVFAPMGRFQLESIYLYLPGTTVENKGKLIILIIPNNKHLLQKCDNCTYIKVHTLIRMNVYYRT